MTPIVVQTAVITSVVAAAVVAVVGLAHIAVRIQSTPQETISLPSCKEPISNTPAALGMQ